MYFVVIAPASFDYYILEHTVDSVNGAVDNSHQAHNITLPIQPFIICSHKGSACQRFAEWKSARIDDVCIKEGMMWNAVLKIVIRCAVESFEVPAGM
jgi:hypothetical protein